MERIKATMLLIEESKQRNSDLRAVNNSLFDEVHGTKEASKQMFNELIRKFYNLKFNKTQKKLVKHQNEDPEQPTNSQRKQGKVTFILEQKQVCYQIKTILIMLP